MSILVQCSNLSKRYVGNDQDTLHDINLSVESNQLYFIKGPSGSGKSTLLNILSLLDVLTAGVMFFNGENVTDLSASQKSQLLLNDIGMIFQKYNLLSHLNVIENIIVHGLYADFSNKKEIIQRAEAAMELLKIEELRNRKINQLSGGQQQRVAIARVLLQEPKLLLADEPTANVDKETEAVIMELFEQYRQKGTLIVVSHNDNYAKIVDKSYLLKDGRLLMHE